MAIRTTHLLTAAVVSLAALVTPSGVRGANAPTGERPAAPWRAAAEAAEVAALRSAFNLLLTANHNYDGHRVKAMQQIAQACRRMDVDIVPPEVRARWESRRNATRPATEPATKSATKPTTRAGGKRGEPKPQNVSDAQLRQAKDIVQQVRKAIPAGKQPRISELLGKASEEIDTALSIK
jgi:hypothetical protein